jgi:hypothetical protein
LCASCYIANAASTTQFTHDVSSVYTKKLCLNGGEWNSAGKVIEEDFEVEASVWR